MPGAGEPRAAEVGCRGWECVSLEPWLRVPTHGRALRQRGESLARRPTGKDEETTIRGVRDYLTALAKLDREHPQFHGKLKDRIAAVSLTAARSRHTMFTAGRDDVKDVMALQADIAALYDYCDPLILY